jgi:hypothetical protein
MTKQKLIEQYQSKITDCDTLLNAIKEKKRKIRKDGIVLGENSANEWNDLCNERSTISAQRQCYVQIISDLEYELD